MAKYKPFEPRDQRLWRAKCYIVLRNLRKDDAVFKNIFGVGVYEFKLDRETKKA